jgi:hypothetical protein
VSEPISKENPAVPEQAQPPATAPEAPDESQAPVTSFDLTLSNSDSDRITSPTEQQQQDLESVDVLTAPATGEVTEASVPAPDQAQATKQVEGYDSSLYEDMLNAYDEDEDKEEEDEDEEDSDEEAYSEEEEDSEDEEEEEEEDEEGSDEEQGSDEEVDEEEEGSEEEEESEEGNEEEGSEAEVEESDEEEDEELDDEKPKRKKGRQLESGIKDLQKMLKATPVNASKEDLLNNLENLESGSDESEGDEITPAENDVKDLIK